MLESLYIGMSGLQGYTKGLRVISNNVTNLNTPGFKAAKQQFADAFYLSNQLGSWSGGTASARYGTGLNTLSTTIDYRIGELRQTGNGLDVAIDGEGFFVVDVDGDHRYTRAGQFAMNDEGFLVLQSTAHRVLGYGSGGTIAPISLAGLRVNPARGTSQVTVSGNLSSTASEGALEALRIRDASGAEHVLRMVFRVRTDNPQPGAWIVEIRNGDEVIHSDEVQFVDGRLPEGSRTLTFDFDPPNASAQTVTVNLSEDLTSFASGSVSTLVVTRQDGYEAGSLTEVSFSEEGVLELTYSNGQTATGSRLAIAMFGDPQALEQLAGGMFAAADGMAQMGSAGVGGRGKVNAGRLELSNVDLSAEFSELIVMQRGYQASSRVVTTANEMLQELFDLKGRR